MINSSNKIYSISPSLPQLVEASFSDAESTEKVSGQKTEKKETDQLIISENLDVRKEDYRKTLENSQLSISFGQNAVKNIDEVKQNILDYKNTDEKELTKEDFLKSIEKNINNIQKFSPVDNSSQGKAVDELLNVLSQVKEELPSLNDEEVNKVLEKAYKDVDSSKDQIDKNISSVVDSVQEDYASSIKDKQSADDVIGDIKFLIKGNPEKIKEIQKKAIDGDTILSLLKAV